jgi:hypothetical protein
MPASAAIVAMLPIEARKRHKEAWGRLFDLVEQRNMLLRQLGTMATFASEFSPATDMFMEFDFDMAREILAKVEPMSPRIYAAIDELNRYAGQIGKPKIERRKMMP